MSCKVQCRYHPYSNLIEDYRAGDMICSECGLVVGDRVIDVGSEWRTFSNDNPGEDKSRVGGQEDPLLGPNLSTFIGPSPVFGQTKYSGHQNVSNSERALRNAFSSIASIADRINLPNSITFRAKQLFKMVYEGKTLKGRSHDAISAACVYIACRQEGVPRSFKEIVATCSVSKVKISRCFQQILKEFDIKTEMITTDDFMQRFCSNLNLTNMLAKVALHVAKTATDMDIAPGRSPISIAAAAIYVATQVSKHEKKSLKEIADVAGVSKVTIEQSYRLMVPRIYELLPMNLQHKISHNSRKRTFDEMSK